MVTNNEHIEPQVEQAQTQEDQASAEAKRLPNSKAVIAYLAELFPNCFTIVGDALPLKIGIFEDLAKRLEGDEKVSKTRLRTALRQYTNSWRYLRVVKAGGTRVDLVDAEAGVIEAEHESHAQETLEASRAKVQEAQKAQRDAQREAQQAQREAQNAKQAASKPSPKKPTRKVEVPKRKAKAEPVVTMKDTVKADALVVGQRVSLKLGNNPMVATVTTIDKTEAQVQLDSGMTIKVAITELHEV